MARKTKAEKKMLDALIEAAYSKHGQNVQINMLDIPNIFKAGHAAVAAGTSVEEAVIAAIAKYRVN